MKYSRHISVLLLLVFAAFLGHNMAPHHHGEGPFHSESDKACCHHEHAGHTDDHTDKSDHGSDNTDHAGHCHAFNNVDIAKVASLSGQLWCKQVAIKVPFLEECPVIQTPGYSENSYSYLILPIRGPVLSGSLVLRGPPVLV